MKPARPVGYTCISLGEGDGGRQVTWCGTEAACPAYVVIYPFYTA